MVPRETSIQVRLPPISQRHSCNSSTLVYSSFNTLLFLSSGNIKICWLVTKEIGKSQAAIWSSDCASPAGVHFSGIFMYGHSDMRRVDGEALVSLSLQGDVQKSARPVNSGPRNLSVNSRGTAPSHSGGVKNSM